MLLDNYFNNKAQKRSHNQNTDKSFTLQHCDIFLFFLKSKFLNHDLNNKD